MLLCIPSVIVVGQFLVPSNIVRRRMLLHTYRVIGGSCPWILVLEVSLREPRDFLCSPGSGMDDNIPTTG